MTFFVRAYLLRPLQNGPLKVATTAIGTTVSWALAVVVDALQDVLKTLDLPSVPR